MSNLTYVYQKNRKGVELLDTLNYTLDEFKNNSAACYPNWNKENMIVSSEKYEYPCISPEGELREKTREERILEGATELLQDGEYVEGGKIITVPAPEDLLKKVWDNITHSWREGANENEILNHYKNLINTYKAEILENGFDFNGHQQKCREKDLALLGNAVSALDDMQTFKISAEEHRINWAFNDNDIVNMTETELRRMRIAGAEFINNVYGVEATLKAAEPNILLKKEDFISRIDELSDVKCYKKV